LEAEIISSIAILISLISLAISWFNRGEDQKVRVAEKHSELVILIGQFEVAIEQSLIELSEAAYRTKETNKGYSHRFEVMYDKYEGMLKEINSMREFLDNVRKLPSFSKAIAEIERIKGEIAVQQTLLTHTLQEIRAISTLLSDNSRGN